MKTRSFFLAVIFAAAAPALLTSCSGEKKDHSDAHDAEHASGDHAKEASEPQYQVDQKFREQLGAFFTSYVALTEAFVDSAPQQVKAEAAETTEALAKVDMKLLSGAAHNDWMNYVTPMQSSLTEIQASDDIETQRQSFSTLSDNLYKSVKAFGLGGEEVFYDYCPMAFDNEGGYWLSNQEQIRNPYFGDKMLTCGSVQERLK